MPRITAVQIVRSNGEEEAVVAEYILSDPANPASPITVLGIDQFPGGLRASENVVSSTEGSDYSGPPIVDGRQYTVADGEAYLAVLALSFQRGVSMWAEAVVE